MKILHTEASQGWGGQEIRILSEAAGMLARGHEVQLICTPQSRIYQEAPRYGVIAHALPIGKKRLPGLFALRRWLQKNPVDVINSHSSTDSWLAALACASLRNAPPLVRSRHVSVAVPNNFTTRWLYQKASRLIVTTGESLRDTLIRDNGLRPDAVISVPTGIDTALFQPADKARARNELNLPQQRWIIGMVATLRSWKGHRYLLEAFAQLNDPNALLVIVGDGPQAQALQQQSIQLGLQQQCCMVGNQTNVARWLQAFDCFVLPSYANEGVPQALLQAMLTGLPCITTNAGAIPEIARDQETAWVVEKENPQAILQALQTLKANPVLAERIAQAGRLWCAAHHSRAMMLDKMQGVFQKAINGV